MSEKLSQEEREGKILSKLAKVCSPEEIIAIEELFELEKNMKAQYPKTRTLEEKGEFLKDVFHCWLQKKIGLSQKSNREPKEFLILSSMDKLIDKYIEDIKSGKWE